MSQLALVRLPDPPSGQTASRLPALTCCARLDPCSAQHAAYVDSAGVLHYLHVNATAASVTCVASFQLLFCADPQTSVLSRPVAKGWQTFQFVPGQPGELMLVQQHSGRILYATLPRQPQEPSYIFLFGSHLEPVTALITNDSVALSGSADGALKMWRLQDGQLADTRSEAMPCSITALEFLGPLMVAAGTEIGTVTVLDISTHRLLPVQRFSAGPGPVTCLAAHVDSEMLSQAALADAPRGPDGGGIVPAPAALPWRSAPFAVGRASPMGGGEAGAPGPKAPLLCVASQRGWLRLYSASNPSAEQPWQLLHSVDTMEPISSIAFSPWGDAVAVASPAAQLLNLETVALAEAGRQPGVISVYACSDWQLVQQWGLRSAPKVGLFLPACALQLLDGKRLAALQVLHLLVVPEQGEPGVVQGTRLLESEAENAVAQSTDRQQQGPQRAEQEGDGAAAVVQAGLMHGHHLHPDIGERDLSAIADAIATARPSAEDGPSFMDELLAMQEARQQPQQAQPRPAGPAGASAVDQEGSAHRAPMAGSARSSGPGTAEGSGQASLRRVMQPSTRPLPRTWERPDTSATDTSGAHDMGLPGQTSSPVAAAAAAGEATESAIHTGALEPGTMGAAARPTAERGGPEPAAAATSPRTAATSAAQHRAQAAAAGTGAAAQRPGTADVAQGAERTTSEQLLRPASAPTAAHSSAQHGVVDLDEQPPQPRQLPARLMQRASTSRLAPVQSADSDSGASSSCSSARAPEALPVPVSRSAGLTRPQPATSAPGHLQQQQGPVQVDSASAAGSGLRSAIDGRVHTNETTARAMPSQQQQQQQQQQEDEGRQPSARVVRHVPPTSSAAAGSAAFASMPLQQGRSHPSASAPPVRPQQDIAAASTAGLSAAGPSRGAHTTSAATAAAARVLQEGVSRANAPSATVRLASNATLAQASINSTRIIEGRIKALESQPVEVHVGPETEAVRKLAGKMGVLDLPLEAQQYQGLQPIDSDAPARAQKLVQKQLDPRWIASRGLKPRMDALWHPHEWQPEVSNTRPVALRMHITPQMVASQLMQLPLALGGF